VICYFLLFLLPILHIEEQLVSTQEENNAPEFDIRSTYKIISQSNAPAANLTAPSFLFSNFV
jgi:hypothetical protein